MSILIFLGGRTLSNGKRHIEKKGDNFILTEKSIKYGLFSEDKWSDTFLKVIWYAKSENQCLQAEKWRLIELICMFSRWPPKSYRILHCC